MHNEVYDNELHARGGPLNVADPRSPSRASIAFLEAAAALGMPRIEDLNVAKPDGVGFYQTTTIDGERCTTARAYLTSARRRPNLEIVTNAHATRILTEGLRAIGVEYRREGAPRRVRAHREVIVSAGTNKSPQLLLLSGIGPAETLRRFGIEVVHDLPGVGGNYQEPSPGSAASRAAFCAAIPRCRGPTCSASSYRRSSTTSHAGFTGDTVSASTPASAARRAAVG